MPITELPSDVFGQIVGHIESYSDVLNVALSNKVLSSASVPGYLQYHDIRTRLLHPALWERLSHPDDLRAVRVRSLTIIPDNYWDFYEIRPEHNYDLRERLPPHLTPSGPPDRTSDNYRSATASMVLALRRMSRLERFGWYCKSALVSEAGLDDVWETLQYLGTVRELSIFDVAESQEQAPVINTNAVLVLELDLQERFNSTANLDPLLSAVTWPHLRVLRLRGMNCRVPSMTRFLTSQPLLEELALAQMMPGHAWTRLRLPSDALPRLRHLECSSAQAAALLRNSDASIHLLETLLGIEVHDTVVDSQYFSLEHDDDWWDMDHDDEDEQLPSPWKALFVNTLEKLRSLTRLGVVSLSTPEEMETLATVTPQLKQLEICPAYDFKIPDTEWHRLYSLFPSLEVTWSRDLIWFSDDGKTPDLERANIQIQALARACPRLRVIVPWNGKLVIIRDGSESVRWVVRKSWETEEPHMQVGERVYGL
ncbi:hypothetical protein DXG01_014493 [Tephrocybe rancida]|nr:hypothetical protein DXG01_014493 [Tephrocybe rancida]